MDLKEIQNLIKFVKFVAEVKLEMDDVNHHQNNFEGNSDTTYVQQMPSQTPSNALAATSCSCMSAPV
jgi:hypothetical protein